MDKIKSITNLVNSKFWIMLLIILSPLYGKLSLVSTTPADGTTDVDTLATVILVFSEALDTTARFEDSDDFYLGIEMFSRDSISYPEEIIISESLDTIFIRNLALASDAKYILFLQAARSSTGHFLDRPYVITFSTGNSLPAASVSGSINFTGGDPEASFVQIYESELLYAEDGDPEAAAVVPLSGSNYTAKYLAPGNYFVLGFKDVDKNGVVEFPDDAFGGYDNNGDHIIDLISIGEGANLTGVDLTISVPDMFTARENYPTAQNIAQQQSDDAVLTFVGCDLLSVDGRAQNWMYGFYSLSEDKLLGVSSIGNMFLQFPIPYSEEDSIIQNIPLPENWLDSDIAADSADANGGSNFLDTYPDVEINAFASNLIIPQMSDARLAINVNEKKVWTCPKINLRTIYKPETLHKRIARMDTIAVWVFFYFSEAAEAENVILLDVETGSPIEFPGIGEVTTARGNLDLVDQYAGLWSSDAELIIVGNLTSEVSTAGYAEAWSYTYFSESKDSVSVFYVFSGSIMGPITGPPEDVYYLEGLPENWLDTDEVTPTAEAESNDFRNNHTDEMVQALLSKGVIENDSSRAVWHYRYYSPAAMELVEVYIDALTGNVVGETSIKPDPQIPTNYSLEQNYPNPFNSNTQIQFWLPEDDRISLKIYNLQGIEIAELINKDYKPGIYNISWNGMDKSGNSVASGIYFYQLKTKNFIKSRKMILTR